MVLLFGALVALTQLTTPTGEAIAGDTTTTTTADEPLVAPTTTTTIDVESFSASDITTGARFSWIKSPGVGSLWPVDLVYHGDRVYLFGSEQVSQAHDAGLGLIGWVSDDAISWSRLNVPGGTDERATPERVGLIPRDHAVFRVVGTDTDLVALTVDVGTGAPVVWSSKDGSDWEPSELPVEPGSLASSTFELNDAVVVDGQLFVAGVMFTDALDQVRRALPEDLVGEYRDAVELDFTLTAAGGLVDVYGPLGLHGFSIWLDELGLDETTKMELFRTRPPTRQFVWSKTDAATWRATEVDSSAAERLWARPDDVLVAYGPGRRQSAIAMSRNGTDWEIHARSSRAWIYRIGALGEWGDYLVGGGLGEDLFVTRNGLDWEFAGTGELLPDAINWTLQPAAGGSGGLAVVANALSANPEPAYTPVIIEKDNSTLTLDLQEPTLRLDHPDVERIIVPLWQTRTFDVVTVDFPDETITLNHPETGEPLVSFDFATIQRAAESAVDYDSSAQRALLFTTDGDEWTVQSLTEEIGANSAVDKMVVLEDRVVMVTFPPVAEPGTEAPNITIRVGLIR